VYARGHFILLYSLSGEAHLHQKLGEQSSWLKPKLLAFRLELNRQTALLSAQLVREAASKTTVRTAVSFLAKSVQLFLSIAAYYFQAKRFEVASTAIVVAMLSRLVEMTKLDKIDLASLVCWVALNSVALGWKFGILSSNADGLWVPLSLFCIVISVVNGFPRRGQAQKPQKTKKPLYTPNLSKNYFNTSADEEEEEQLGQDFEEETFQQEKKEPSRNSSSSTRHRTAELDEQLLSFPEREFHLRPGSQLGSIYGRRSDNPFFSCTAQSGAGSLLRTPSAFPSRPQSRQSRTGESENSRCDVSTLSLADGSSDIFNNSGSRPGSSLFLPIGPAAAATGPGGTAFSLRTYGAVNSSGINFGDRTGSTRRKHQQPRGPFLKPAKTLKNWVAGGYWQSPAEMSVLQREENLSRSSSQTSGFVSEKNGFSGDQKEMAAMLPMQFLQHSSRSCSRASSGSSSSLDRLTQTAFAELRPKAESSPIEKKDEKKNPASMLERRISINCSVYSVLLAASAGGNLALAAYFLVYV
jgi:hypothetical protein